MPDVAPGLGAGPVRVDLPGPPAAGYLSRAVACCRRALPGWPRGSPCWARVLTRTWPSPGTLRPGAMAQMSVLWSIVFLLGLGVFFPVEQELIRLVAARLAAGEGITPVVRRAAAAAAALLAVVLLPMAVATRPLADRLFDGDTAMVAVLATAALASRSPR